MRVFVLLTLLSLTAAQQCGNSCNCGNSACCQNNYASGSPYNVFNIGYNQQITYGQQYGSNARRNFVKTPCLKVTPIPISLTQVYQNQPVFTRVVPNNDVTRQIDNICSTLFPLPDDSSTYVIYDSTVYSDGSNSVVTTISTDIGLGTYLRGNPDTKFFQRIFASLGDNMFVGCTHLEYGESSSVDVFVTTLGSVSPLGGQCVQQAQNIIQCVGQDVGQLYVLPYRLTPRCVTQQACSPFNPLLNTTPYQY